MEYKDALQLFELEDNTDIESIRKQYRKLCLKHHPDKNGGTTDSVAMFQTVQEAYIVLMDNQEDDQDEIDLEMNHDTEYSIFQHVIARFPKWLQPLISTFGI